jgi:curli biogenesis system outer membrane secretion channel CsgG
MRLSQVRGVRTSFLMLLFGALLVGCVPQAATPATPGSLPQTVQIRYDGPRETLAVIDTTNIRLSGSPLKERFLAILTEELIVHPYFKDRFSLVERVKLDQVLKEQRLSAAGLSPTDAPRIGKLLGARYLLLASVVNAKTSRRSTGALGVRIDEIQGTVEVALSLVDSENGRVLARVLVSQSDTRVARVSTGLAGVNLDPSEELVSDLLRKSVKEALEKMLIQLGS